MKFYVKGSQKPLKSHGLPNPKPGKDMDNLYTWPLVGYFGNIEDAKNAMARLRSAMPKALYFVEEITAAK